MQLANWQAELTIRKSWNALVLTTKFTNNWQRYCCICFFTFLLFNEYLCFFFSNSKGNDDLRQDAVMQQLFSQVTRLLKEHDETKRRELHMRVYKVIPLTPCAGLLEWVENTSAIGDYLIGTQE